MTTPGCPSYAGYRVPGEIISYPAWLYVRFPLSLQHVDERLAARGIEVSHETVRKHWLWCAVDQHGTVLDILVQSRRDKRAAKRLLRKLLKAQCRPPRVMITDKLASYGAAKKEIMPSVEHRQHKGSNNRAENSHQPTRGRERQMQRFKSARHTQRVLAAHDQISNLSHLRRHDLPAAQYRAARAQALRTWAEITGLAASA